MLFDCILSLGICNLISFVFDCVSGVCCLFVCRFVLIGFSVVPSYRQHLVMGLLHADDIDDDIDGMTCRCSQMRCNACLLFYVR